MPIKVLPNTSPPLTKMQIVAPGTWLATLLFVSFLQNLWSAITSITQPRAASDLGRPIAGARGFVNDATTVNFGDILAGGGTNPAPVWADGANWRIG